MSLGTNNDLICYEGNAGTKLCSVVVLYKTESVGGSIKKEWNKKSEEMRWTRKLLEEKVHTRERRR